MNRDMSQMPTGGLGSFLTSNMDEIDDNILAFGKGQGINSMSKIANRMANMGRNGDNQLVHVKTGELIVSPEILEKNPKLAKELTQSFQNMDENIGDYVVGSDGNSINPMTGQREFFLKGLVKGIKNIFSKVAGFVLPGLIGMIPGANKMIGDQEIDDDAFKFIEVIIGSMTPKERSQPDILDQSRRKRIANGSGRDISEINQLIKQSLSKLFLQTIRD